MISIKDLKEGKISHPDWDIVYESAYRPDGSLFFPDRLSEEFLASARRSMGSYVFANQFLNEILPDDQIMLKKDWIKYYDAIPEKVYTFAFIDPAISQEKSADFTALVVVSVDHLQNWYVRTAQRFKINPTQIVELCFRVAEQFKPQAIGIEDVAYQKALLYMVSEEMRRRGKIIPVTGVHPGTDKTKEMRILGLVPRFEWGHIFLARGLNNFELEYSQFPRGAHDDLLDALSMIEKIVYYPQEARKNGEKPNPNHPDYEKWYRAQLVKRSSGQSYDLGNSDSAQEL